MVVKVLVVDDSGFFRRRVSEILSADPTIQVIGTATNGKEAIDHWVDAVDRPVSSDFPDGHLLDRVKNVGLDLQQPFFMVVNQLNDLIELDPMMETSWEDQ